MNLCGKRILVTGGSGFLGRAVCERLKACQPAEVIIPPHSADWHGDLRHWKNCERLLAPTLAHDSDWSIEVVIHLAARCGGIGANQARPGEFLYDNAVMGLHLMEAARQAGVEKFVLVGTCCSYPKHCPAPFREADLWAGYPEETNAPYGLAKRLLIAQAQAYRQQYGFDAISLILANLYGPCDCFESGRSHVIPALIRKLVEAKLASASACTAWGTGNPTRDFLYVEDAAEGIVRAAERYDGPEPINLGTGRPMRIFDLAHLIREMVGFQGAIQWDAGMPDGQPERWLDTQRAEILLGWTAPTSLRAGLQRTVDWYLSQI